MSPDDAPDSPPAAFGAFRVLHQIGVGVLGPVYRTYEPGRDRLAAVKLFRLDLTPEQARQLAEELVRLVELNLFHPSIVTPLAAGLEGSAAYFAEEYVAAESLDVAMRHYAPAPMTKVLPFITQLAGAVDFACASHVCHGTLHPRDVFVTPDEARATGFGIAGALERLGVRTPVRRPYSAPERIGGAPWGTAADVFALTAIACELLSGRRVAGTGAAAVAGIADPGDAIAPDTLQAILARGLHEDPAERYRCALDLAAAIESAMSQPAAVAPPVAFAPAPVEAAPAAVENAGAAGADDGSAVPGAAAESPRKRRPRAPKPAVEPEIVPAAVLEATPAPAAASPEAEPSLFDGDEFAPSGTAPDPDTRADAFAADERRDEGDDRFVALEDPAPPGTLAWDDADGADGEAAARNAGHDIDEMAPASLLDSPREAGRPAVHQPDSDGAGYVPAESERPRGVMLPYAFTLLGGLLVGFLAGYGMGTRERVTTEPSAAATPSVAGAPKPAGTGWTEGKVSDSAPAPVLKGEIPPSTDVAKKRADPRSPARTTGRIVVRSNPAGAQVTINGRARGTTPLSLGDIAYGTYTVRVSHAGYEPVTRRVEVSARTPNGAVTTALPRSRASAGDGALTINSRPAGARVLLDGRPVGKTPLTLRQVKAGSHVVRLDYDGYQRWSASVTVAAGDRRRINASLDRAPRR